MRGGREECRSSRVTAVLHDDLSQSYIEIFNSKLLWPQLFLLGTNGFRLAEALTTGAIMQALMNVNVTIKAKVLLAFWTTNTSSWHVSCISKPYGKFRKVKRFVNKIHLIRELVNRNEACNDKTCQDLEDFADSQSNFLEDCVDHLKLMVSRHQME